MRNALFIPLVLLLLLTACRKAQITATVNGTGTPGWTDSSLQHPKNPVFTNLLEKYRQKGLPGISLLVMDSHGTWTGETGFADIENKRPFHTTTVSKVASITKLFMGALVFRLIEDSMHTGMGYSSLDQKISHWLPERIIRHLPNGDKITLGQCMKHETGIPDVISQDNFYLAVLNNPNHIWTQEELLGYIYDMPAEFNAGDTAVYSNTNTILITMVMEAQTGTQHADLLKKYITQPLGLTSTFYQPHETLPNTVAQGYFDLYNNSTIVNVSNLVTGSGNGYGGIYSNLFDLYKFADALLIRQTLLSPQSMTKMLQFGKRDDTNFYGYGIQKSFLDQGNNWGIGHKGRDLGYTANLFYFPAKGVLHIFFINYGTDADSGLKQVFREFQDELVALSLQ